LAKKVNHQQLGSLIKAYYKTKTLRGKKLPLIIYGTFGVGKSTLIRDKAKEIAEKKSKELIEWNEITRDRKDEIVANPEKFFVLIDVRLSEFDSSDVKGLPDFTKDKTAIEWKIPYFAKLLANPQSDGILFFDEINLATPLVISSTYKIIHDRVVNESKINDNWLILCAGNKDDDRAYTHELASPVKDRAGEVELLPAGIEDWTDWATENGLDSRIIGFLNWKPSNLHKVNFEDGQKYTTERGWERLHSLIRSVTDFKELDLVSGTAIGEGIAREFVAFCKIKDSVDLDKIISNPNQLKSITETSIRYFIVTALAERYKDKKVTFEKLLEISKVLDENKCAEFVALLWKLSIKYARERFRKDFTTKDLDNPLRKKYHQYLVE
jgi:hypothetical protein